MPDMTAIVPRFNQFSTLAVLNNEYSKKMSATSQALVVANPNKRKLTSENQDPIKRQTMLDYFQ